MGFVRPALLAVSVGSVLALLAAAAEEPLPPGARLLSKGLLHRELTVEPGSSGDGFTLQVLDVDPSALDVRVLDARQVEREVMTAREYCASFGAIAAVNGGFFLPDLKPLGLVVSDRKVQNPLRKADWGVFYVGAGRARIVHTRDFKLTDDVEQALQVGPRLVVNGEPTQLKPQSARRTLVGVDLRGHVTLAVCSRGEALASDLADVARRPVAKGGLGLAFALALDGGHSSQLYVRVADLEVDVAGAWGVPNAIGIHARESGRS